MRLSRPLPGRDRARPSGAGAWVMARIIFRHDEFARRSERIRRSIPTK